MPGTLDKTTHKQGVTQYYIDYANLTDMDGNLATQAMIIIDPGEEAYPGYTDSEQIGLPHKALPHGQLQYDVDPTGVFCDDVVHTYMRGVLTITAKSLGNQSLSWIHDPEVFGAETEVIHTEKVSNSGPRSWVLPKR